MKDDKRSFNMTKVPYRKFIMDNALKDGSEIFSNDIYHQMKEDHKIHKARQENIDKSLRKMEKVNLIIILPSTNKRKGLKFKFTSTEKLSNKSNEYQVSDKSIKEVSPEKETSNENILYNHSENFMNVIKGKECEIKVDIEEEKENLIIGKIVWIKSKIVRRMIDKSGIIEIKDKREEIPNTDGTHTITATIVDIDIEI